MRSTVGKPTWKPRARKVGLEIQVMGDELLIYDLERHRAHGLGPLASLVFRSCDGRTDVQELARLVAGEFAVREDRRLVSLVLARLARARLLEEGQFAAARYSRREFVSTLKRLGLAASMVLPLVSSIVSPTAAHALSCVPNNACGGMPNCTPCMVPGGHCSDNYRCCNGRCLPPGQAKAQCGC